jgi:uncharacterized protein (TIGR00369 family)
MNHEAKPELSPEEKARILLERLSAGFDVIPFNQHIGLKMTEVTADHVKARFHMQPHLIGNTFKQILHGGVIATVLDAVGGAMGMTAAYQKMRGEPREEKMVRVAKFGTIDMRVDYLQPGRGEWFEATGKLLRIGKKVCVTQMELTNNDGELIAVGTGTYLY